MSKETITVAKRPSDGSLVEVEPDGAATRLEDRTDWDRVRSMTDEQVHTAAATDPDAQPATDDALARARRTPRVKIIRRALRLTQEEFAARFYIPLGTLRDWEQGKTVPDQAAQAYLRAIAGDAAAVQQALQAAPRFG